MKVDQRLLTERDFADIQGLVIYGTKSPLLRYHLLKIRDAAGARRFIATFLGSEGLRVSTAGTGASPQEDARDFLLYLALTYRGLESVGVPAPSLATFPQDFREGPAARKDVVGDVGKNDPSGWAFAPDDVHIVVMLYARDADGLHQYSGEIVNRASSLGCELVAYFDGAALPDFEHESGQMVTRPVHFGFSDSISQPDILEKHCQPTSGPPAVPPGMFVLGHEDPPDASLTGKPFSITSEPVPQPDAVWRNGTFGAFRLLAQDVAGFEDHLDASSTDRDARELYAARMCGRWRNGVPLALSPDTPTPWTAVNDLNDFDYRPSEGHPDAADDAHGQRCPISSHLRRSNPRSAEVLGNMGHRVRLIRRGMPYGPPYQRGVDDGIERGILGLFLCVSLQDQFEFIMKNWLLSGLAARGLEPDNTDPFMRFVTTRGGLYLLFPSVTALTFISQLNQPAVQPPPPTATNDERMAFIVQNMRGRVGTGTARDAHPKHHGIVVARFQVHEDIPERYRKGLFASAGSYRAYIRFSNGSPRQPQADAVPDVRGMAIKLLDVKGPKQIDDEKETHDFLLASHPVFFTRNLAHYVQFLETPLPFLLRAFPHLGASFQLHDNPLTIRYFSQTPYALGAGQAVKYMVQPIDPAEEPSGHLTPADVAGRSPDYLREALAARLASAPATLVFGIQPFTDAATTPIDDPTVLWTSAFQPLATITIAPQEFRNPRQDTFAQLVSMSPWHCLAEHTPLGDVNEVRRRVYNEASKQRHANGRQAVREPDGLTDF